MGYMYLDFKKNDGTVKRIFLNDDYKIINGFKNHRDSKFLRVDAWDEIPCNVSTYNSIDYFVEFEFGEFTKSIDESHVMSHIMFDGAPRRHLKRLKIMNVRTGTLEYVYKEGCELEEPFLFRNQFGHPVINCINSEITVSRTSSHDAKSHDLDEDYIKIYVKLSNGKYIPLYINGRTVKNLLDYKCSIKSIDIAGYTEIPVTAEDRGDYRVILKVAKNQGKYRILTVDATKVDYDSKPEQSLDTLIQVFYKVVDTVGNLGWGVNPIHQEKAKSGYVMKDKLDEILSKPDLEDMNNSYVSIFGRENDDPNAPLRHIATRRLCQIAIIPAYLYDSLNSLFDDDSNENDTTSNKSCGCVSGGCENCDCDIECGTCSGPEDDDEDNETSCNPDCNNCVVRPIFRFLNDGKW